MPIRLNLLAEQQEAEEARRRDPVKRAIWMGSFLVALMLVWSISLFIKGRMAISEKTDLEKTQANIQADFMAATNSIVREGDLLDRTKLLNRFTTNRFLWGTALNSMQNTVIDDVQLTVFHASQDFKMAQEFATNTLIPIIAYFRGTELASPIAGLTNRITGKTTILVGSTTNQAYTNIDIVPLALNWYNFKTPPAMTNVAVVTKIKTDYINEMITIKIAGKVFGNEQTYIGRANLFKTNIMSHPMLKEWLRPVNGVSITGGLNTPTPDPIFTNELSSSFTMECYFKDRKRKAN